MEQQAPQQITVQEVSSILLEKELIIQRMGVALASLQEALEIQNKKVAEYEAKTPQVTDPEKKGYRVTRKE